MKRYPKLSILCSSIAPSLTSSSLILFHIHSHLQKRNQAERPNVRKSFKLSNYIYFMMIVSEHKSMS